MYRCLLLFSFLFFSGVAFGQSFLQGTEDVPLMSDLQVCENDTFSFHDEEGRLFFSKALTQNEPDIVMAFYDETLPSLGWQKNEKGFFEREDDVLKIAAFPEEDGQTGVFFELIAK